MKTSCSVSVGIQTAFILLLYQYFATLSKRALRGVVRDTIWDNKNLKMQRRSLEVQVYHVSVAVN